MSRIRNLVLLGSSSLAVALAQAAVAEESRSNPTVVENTLEEIIVTAQKRSESINSVPMTITAVSGEELQRAGVKSTDDLVKIVPSLSVAKSQSNTPIYTMRGVGFQSQNLTSTSPVGIYVDEVAYAYPYMASNVAFDLQRVEVLKGPQGTLFGRSTTGGVVNFIAAKPQDTAQGTLGLEYGSYGNFGAQGYYTGPISPTLSYRIAGSLEKSQDGWQRSQSRPSDRLGKVDRKAMRGSLLWTPSENLESLLTVSYWKDQSETQAPQAIGYVPGNPAFADPRINASLIPNPTDGRQADWTPASYQPTPARVRPPFAADGEFKGFSLRVNYRLSDTVNLTSLTSYGEVDRSDATSVDGVATEVLTNINPGSVKSFSQELRLSGDTDQFKWLVGANFADDKLKEDVIAATYDASAAVGIRTLAVLLKVNPALAANILGVPAPFQPGFIALAGLNTAAYTMPELADGFHTNKFSLEGRSRSTGFFANTEMKVNDELSVNLGARYTKNSATNLGCVYDLYGRNQAFAAFLGTLILRQPTTITQGQCLTLKNDFSGFSAPIRGRLSENNVSFRGSVNWTPTPDLLTYASISRGYKSGGFPALPANVAAQLDPVTQERLNAYEIGMKNSLLDKRMQLNLSAYYYDYKDKQVYAKIPDIIFGTLNRLMNVPKSEVYGLEADLSAVVATGLTLHLGGTWTQSKIKQFNAYDDTGAPRDFAGARLTYTPELSLVGSVDYNRAISGDMLFQYNVSFNYQSDTNGRFAGGVETAAQRAADQPFRIKARTVVDTSIGIGNDKWKADVFARNLFNTYYWTTADSQLDTVFRFAGMPRTVGIRVTRNF